MRFKKWYMLIFIVIFSLLVACADETGNNNDNNNNNNNNIDNQVNNNNNDNNNVENEIEPEEDVTLRMMIMVDDEVFNNRFKRQIEEEFPHITLELIEENPVDIDAIQELYANGEEFDIITVEPTIDHIELETLMPIDDLIEKHNFDLSVFRDGIIDDLRAYDPLGEGNLYGLPIEIGLAALYYNKDIFDMFGVDYPESGMTWYDALELAKQLTQERDGIQYKGLGFVPWSSNIPYRQLSVPGTDPETGEVLFADHERTKMYFDFLDELRSIPGMQETDPDNPDGFDDGNQNIAMWVASVPSLQNFVRSEGIDFDMVSVPHWPDLPNLGPGQVALSFNITKHSKHPDEAFKVLAHLASPEGQKVLSQAGSPPTIDDESIYEEFAKITIEDYGQDYNVSAPFQQLLAPMPPYSKYNDGLMGFMWQKTNEFMASDQDPNTFIREMKEEYEGMVADMKGRE